MSEQKSGEKPAEEKRPEEDQPPKISALEWGVAILSAICVVAIVAILIIEQIKMGEPVPRISIKLEKVEKQKEHYLVTATAHNDGDKTGSRVECRAELKRGEQTVEQRTARIEFLPPHSKKKIGFYFERDPNSAELTLRPGGYEER
jgi:uncharacterized protein (TIGR02588 family)